MKRIILILTCLFLLAGCSSTISTNSTSDTLSNTGTMQAYTASLEQNNLRTYIAAYKTQLLYMEMRNTEVDFFIYDFQTNTSKSVGTLSDFALKGRSNVIIDDVLYFYISTYSDSNMKNVLYSVNFSTEEMTPISENLYSQKLIPIVEIEDEIIALQGNILSDGSLETFLEIIEDNGTVKYISADTQEVSALTHAKENRTILYIDSSNNHLFTLERVLDESSTQIYLVEYDSGYSCVTTTNITSVFHNQELTDDIGVFYAFDNYFCITDYSGTSIICKYAEGEIETLLCKANLEYVPNLNNSTTYEYFFVRNTNDIYRLNKQTGILEMQNYSLENDQSVIRCAFAYDDILMVIKRPLSETDHDENLYLIPLGNKASENSTERVDTQLLDYIEKTVCLPASASNRTTVCAAKVIGDDRNHLYLYVYKAEYYYQDQKLSRIGVEMFPLSLEIERSGDEIDIIGHALPAEGAQYGSSMRDIFPNSIIEKISLLTQDDFAHIEALADDRAKLMLDYGHSGNILVDDSYN